MDHHHQGIVNFAAQCLLDLSHAEHHNRTPVPLDSSQRSVGVTKDCSHYNNGVVNNYNNSQNAVVENFSAPIRFVFVEEDAAGTTATGNSNESSSLYMAAQILTDLRRMRQEPVQNVASNHDKEDKTDESNEGYVDVEGD
jgi:hypothetical protein